MKTKEEFQKELSDNFIKLLELKQENWIKGWCEPGMIPKNGHTNREYTGCNSINLSIVAKINGWNDPRWYTFLQIKDTKGIYHKGQDWSLKKGSKGCHILTVSHYNPVTKKSVEDDEIDAPENNGVVKTYCNYWTVFNACQIEGIPPLETYVNNDVKPDTIITNLSANMNVDILYDGQGRAYYSPSEDKIHMPKVTSFISTDSFNATALHELAHSTGAQHRLNRKINNCFGDEGYAYEELIAEMTSAFMSANIKLNYDKQYEDNHIAYLQSWAKGIESKPSILTDAIAEAKKATKYMENAIGIGF